MASDPSTSKRRQEEEAYKIRFNRAVPPAPPILRNPSFITFSLPQSKMRVDDVWPRIYGRLVTYLDERRNAESSLRSTAETRLHSIFKTTGGKGAATQNIELALLFKLLRMMDMDVWKEVKSPNQTNDHKVLLLKLNVWALHIWKTLDFSTAQDKIKYVNMFEDKFCSTLQKIRLDSALSTKVASSRNALELLGVMKKIQKTWVSLNVATTTMKNGNIVDKIEEILEQDIKEKHELSTTKDDLLFYKQYVDVKDQLEKECHSSEDTPTSVGIQGRLIREIADVFLQSAKTDKAHADHFFIQALLHRTAMSRLSYKRGLVWIIMLILPHFVENSRASGIIRLMHLTQGLLRQTMTLGKSNSRKHEVSAWKTILMSNLNSEDIPYFHSLILNKHVMDTIPFTDKVFENFYPEVDKQSALQNRIYNTSFVYDSQLDLLDCVMDISLLVPDDSVDPWKVKGTVNWDTGVISED